MKPTRRRKRQPKVGKERNSRHDIITSNNNSFGLDAPGFTDNQCVMLFVPLWPTRAEGWNRVRVLCNYSQGNLSHTRDAIASKCTKSPRPVWAPITRNPCLCPFGERQAWSSHAALLSGCRRLAGRTQGQHTGMQCGSARLMTGGVDDDGCRSDVTNLRDEVVELLLGVAVLLGHVLVLLLPLVGGLLECLDLALIVAGLDVSLAEPVR